MYRLAALMFVAACGDGATLPDAGMGSDGAPRGLVEIHIDGPNAAFNQVFFQNANSSVALATRTDANGDASALVAAGGFVTVVGTSTLYTWTGVQPGDVLTLDVTTEKFTDVFPNAMVRIHPIEGAIEGTGYSLYSKCEVSSVGAAIDEPIQPFIEPCDAKTDLLLLANPPLGYRYRANADIASAGVIDLRGPYLPIESSVDLIGPVARQMIVRQKLVGVTYTSERSAFVDDSHVVVPMMMPIIPGTTVQTSARTRSFFFPKEDAAPGQSEIGLLSWGPATELTTIDMFTPSLREITSEPALDLTTMTLEWTEAPDGVAGDVVWVSLGFESWRWKIIGAHGDETALRLPVLPHEELRPQRATMFLDNFAVIAAEGGYERLRPYLLGNWSPEDGAWWPMKEPSGRVSYRSLR